MGNPSIPPDGGGVPAAAPGLTTRCATLLRELLEAYRSKDGSRYDWIIAVSGGKDSYYQGRPRAGGSFIVRLTRSYDPWVRTAWIDGRRAELSTRIRLSRFLPRYPGRRLDLDVEYERGHRVVDFRVVVIPGRDKAMTRLCTTLPRTPFSLDLVARL